MFFLVVRPESHIIIVIIIIIIINIIIIIICYCYAIRLDYLKFYDIG